VSINSEEVHHYDGRGPNYNDVRAYNGGRGHHHCGRANHVVIVDD